MLLSGTFGEDSGAILDRFWDHFRRPGAPKMEENAFPKPSQKQDLKKVMQGSARRFRPGGEWGGGALTCHNQAGPRDRGQRTGDQRTAARAEESNCEHSRPETDAEESTEEDRTTEECSESRAEHM